MGKYARKYGEVGEIAITDVAQVGVRTRARAMAAEEASSEKAKRTNVGGGQLRLSPSLVKLKNRRRVAFKPENSVSPATSRHSRRRATSNSRRSSGSSDQIPPSCCSSNGSSSFERETLKFVDLEEKSVEIQGCSYQFDRRERREATPSSVLRSESGDMESTARPSNCNSRLRSPDNMPSEAEIEEFFAAAERDLRKKFTDKYNYDVVKDVPLEGCYEWVRVKP